MKFTAQVNDLAVPDRSAPGTSAQAIAGFEQYYVLAAFVEVSRCTYPGEAGADDNYVRLDRASNRGDVRHGMPQAPSRRTAATSSSAEGAPNCPLLMSSVSRYRRGL